MEGVLACHPAEGQHVDTFPPFPHGVVYGAYPQRAPPSVPNATPSAVVSRERRIRARAREHAPP